MRYYIIAGEASGDLHGSNLMRGLHAEDPDAQIRFWGGDMMREAGGTLVHHYKDDAVMGISDVLRHGGRLAANIRHCKADIAAWRPDVVILIDYPGFNLKIARFAHFRGFRVFYYIAPKTWASREGRNRRLKAWVDRLFIVFPFEVPYFRERGIPFVYKGNPLVDAVDTHRYEAPASGPYIAMLAGSRKDEIRRMMPVLMQVADRFPERQFLIAGAPSRGEEDYLPLIGERRNVRVLFGRTYDILKFADAAVINSGTASLEAALTGTPQLVCWSASKLTFFVATRLLRVLKHIRYISLGNLILDRQAFRELLQDDFNADNVAAELRRLTEDASYRERMCADYAQIRALLGGTGASRAVAAAMIETLRELRP